MIYQELDVPPSAQKALDTLSLLSGKWHPVVLVVLAHGEKSGFNDLLSAIPDISGKVLSDTLEALQDAGLVDRTVISQSPLRVQYELTPAGNELNAALESFAQWGTEHLDAVTATILVVESDRRLTHMYQRWLDDRYTVLRAHDWIQLTEAIDQMPDVVFFSSQVPGVDPAVVPAITETPCRTVLLTESQPGFDTLSIDSDELLRKPLTRSTVLAAIDRQLSRNEESENERVLSGLQQKQQLFEQCYSSDTLQQQTEYQSFLDRVSQLTDSMA